MVIVVEDRNGSVLKLWFAGWCSQSSDARVWNFCTIIIVYVLKAVVHSSMSVNTWGLRGVNEIPAEEIVKPTLSELSKPTFNLFKFLGNNLASSKNSPLSMSRTYLLGISDVEDCWSSLVLKNGNWPSCSSLASGVGDGQLNYATGGLLTVEERQYRLWYDLCDLSNLVGAETLSLGRNRCCVVGCYAGLRCTLSTTVSFVLETLYEHPSATSKRKIKFAAKVLQLWGRQFAEVARNYRARGCLNARPGNLLTTALTFSAYLCFSKPLAKCSIEIQI